MNRLSSRLLLPGIVFLMTVALGPSAAPVMAQVQVQGRWQTLPYTMPINPIHVALLRTGKVLIVSGSGNFPANTNFQAALWDPQTGTITTQPVGWDMFCNGMIVLPDGRPFVMGGTLQYDPFHGEVRTSSYDALTNILTDQQSMAHGRWYPTGTVLGDGRVMVFSGLNETGGTNTSVEFYSASSGWSAAFSAPWTPPLYPRMHLLPNGNVFYSGSTTASSLFNPATHAWTTNIAFTNYSGTRTYGSSVLLPLTPANGYKPRVMIFGGGSPSTATTELIDLSAATPKWVYGPSMSQPRIEMDATILPSGQVLALGGSLNDEDTTTASLNADLYDPASNTFSSAGAEVYARLYHSVSLLLPDATVWVAGGNPQRGTYESHMEIYSPRYLFNADGTPATRPTITGTSFSVIGYGSAFQVQTPDAANISSVVLMRNGASTHAFDMDQRYVGLSFTAGSGVLNMTGPPNGNIAPPGYYMLFILNNAGVPSIATIVQVSAAANDVPPTGTITSPASNVTISAGQFVSYSGTGSDPDGTISAYSWSFSGGNPSSSNLANPGSITYATPGTYVTTFTVTDNAGLTDPNPPTRTITVQSDFSVSVSPASQTVSPGGSTSYTTTVSPGTGFTGNVTFKVSGLPTGATASFSPTSITTSGSTTMNVTTTASTPAGNYPLTITATAAGGSSHTAQVTLGVSTSAPPVIGFVQVNAATPQSPQTTVNVPYTAAQTAGNLNIVVAGWNDSAAIVSSVSDTKGNSYTLAAGPTTVSGTLSQAIYYAKNITGALAGANTVAVKFSVAAAYPDIRILEYSGLDPSNPLDVMAAASGSSSPADSGAVTTTSSNELLFGANIVYTGTTGPGAGYTSRIITHPDSDIAEDQVAAATGSYRATAPLSANGPWIMQLIALRGTPATPDTTPPTAPSNLAATGISSGQINLNWIASTDNIGVTGYLIERCQGVNCTNFAQVATTGSVTSYNDSGLTVLTTYSYRVRATDAAGNLSAYSNTASATTPDTTAPTAPSGLTATASSTTQIDLSWTASTDNVGVTGYLVERCQGAGCTTFGQVASVTSGTTYSDTGLTASTTYSYRVRATDAAKNLSSYSNTASATTQSVPDTQPPTAPSNLTASAFSSTQINLSWTASTDNVGVTGYKVERCQGAGCTTFAQVGTPAGTTYNDAGLLANTTYGYRVRATDAAGNLSTYSNTASATTPAAGPPPNIAFVQSNFATPQSSQSQVATTYAAAQAAGDLNVVVIGWNDSSATVSSVTDSSGNTYAVAAPPALVSGLLSQTIYFAKNIVGAPANGNIVTVKFNGSAAYPDIRILEYAGMDPTNPLDMADAATGNSTTATSAAITTTNAIDLIFGANIVYTSTSGPGSGFTSRMITSSDGDIAEDRVVTAAGSYTASAPLTRAGPWIMQVVAFKAHP
jgi:chitodextrinase